MKIYPLIKRKHKYYLCECGAELKVLRTYNTGIYYGVLEYMRCKICKEKMVAQNDKFRGIASK